MLQNTDLLGNSGFFNDFGLIVLECFKRFREIWMLLVEIIVRMGRQKWQRSWCIIFILVDI